MTYAALPFSGGPLLWDGRTYMGGSATVTAARPVATMAGAASVVCRAYFDTPIEIRAAAMVYAEAQAPLRAATTDYITGAGDVPDNRLFPGTVKVPLQFERSIISGGGFSSEVTLGYGRLVLDNSGGEYDEYVTGYAVDGRKVVVRFGAADWRHSQFGVVFSGTATNWHISESEVVIELRDRGFLLDVPMGTTTYAGTGGAEGTPDLAGRTVPQCYGQCINVEPAAEDPAHLVYRVHDGPIQAVDAVHVRGNVGEWTNAGDYPDRAALVAAGITGYQFATCLAEGRFRLASSPLGFVTADVRGCADGGYVDTTAAIVERILRKRAGLRDADFNTAQMAALAAANGATIGFYLPAGHSDEVRQVIARLARGIGAYTGFTRQGQFGGAVFAKPQASESILALDERDIVAIRRQPLPEDIDPTPWVWRVAWGRNWTVQTTDLADAVTDERRAFLREPYRLAVASDDAVKVNHPLAKEPAAVEAFFAAEADAAALAQHLLTTYGGSPSLYSIDTKTQPYLLDVGRVFTVSYPRWDLPGGKPLRVVRIAEDAQRNLTTVTAFG